MNAEKDYNEYKSWDEVNFALKYLAEKKLELKTLESEQEKEINEIKNKNAFKLEILQESIERTEESIKKFTSENIGDFGDKRSKKFTFGKISLKSSKTVVVGCIQTAIKKLRDLKLDDYIRIKEEIAKDSLKKLDAVTLQKIGASIVTNDKINVETN
jgi:phage host-nuclease inhibitor protein Gam